MCKCNQTDGYVQALQNAISVEKKTGVEQAVFIKNGKSFFGNREDVAKVEGICCYILTTGEEIEIEVAVKKTAKNKKPNSKTAEEALKNAMDGIDDELDKMAKHKKAEAS